MLFRNKWILLLVVLLTGTVLKVYSIKIESKLPSLDSLGRQSQLKLREPLIQPLINKDKFRYDTKIQQKANDLLFLPNEMPKFIALSGMMLCFVFIFAVSRDTKDVLIVTNCGAESIAFLKVYGVIPAAACFMVLYSYLVKMLSPQALFYSIVIPFVGFYSLFAFVIYPKREVLHLLNLSVPDGGLSYVINLVRHWTFSLYYIVSEVWGSVGIPLLFWSCANDIFKIDQAKRLYPAISLVGNLGPIISGIAMTVVSRVVAKRSSSEDVAFQTSLQIMSVFCTFAGAVICALFALLQRLHNRDQQSTLSKLSVSTPSDEGSVSPCEKTRKPKQGVVESLRVLSTEPYLFHVAAMVLSYGLTIEFTEIIWKSAVKRAFPMKNDYIAFMGRYSALVGSAAFVMMLVGSSVVRLLGWRAGALVTPVLMALSALPFFGSLLMQGLESPRALWTVVYVGLFQNVLSKASKYSVFDPTKEMAYIPLDSDSKTRGKAAIDVLGARLGKSGGALVQQVLVIAFGSIVQGAPLLALLFYAVIFVWTEAVNKLAPLFKAKSAELYEENISE